MADSRLPPNKRPHAAVDEDGLLHLSSRSRIGVANKHWL